MSQHRDALEDCELEVVARQAGAVLGRVTIGDRARWMIAPPSDPCGQCDLCRCGGPAVCAHARPRELAPRIRVARRWACELADSIAATPQLAAAGGEAAIAYTMYARSGPAPRDPAWVLGSNAVARFLVEILAAKSIAPVVEVARHDSPWAQWVRDHHGAPASGDPGAGVASLGDRVASDRPWRIYVCDDAWSSVALALATPRASITLYGAATAAPIAAIAARELTVVGVAGAHPDLIPEVVAMCARNDIDLVSGTRLADQPAGDVPQAAITVVGPINP